MKAKTTRLNQVKTLFLPFIVFFAVSCNGDDSETIKKEFTIAPTSTFLRADDYDSPSNPLIINLEENGITAGVRLTIRTLGAYINSPTGSTRVDAIGVFSASAQLLGPSELNRVVDAIDAGQDKVTENTFVDQMTTDIPEDFEIEDESIEIVVPSGSKYLFVGNADSKHSDNSTTTEGFKVEIIFNM